MIENSLVSTPRQTLSTTAGPGCQGNRDWVCVRASDQGLAEAPRPLSAAQKSLCNLIPEDLPHPELLRAIPMENLFPQLQGVLTGDLSGNLSQTSCKTPRSRATR